MNKYDNNCDESIPDIVERLRGKELLNFHRLTGLDIDAGEYLELYQKTLARGLLQTTVIYLDTKFWIILRDAANGTNSAGAELLSHLKRLVRERRVLCISQAASFLELVKQSTDSLQVVSRLVDELGESVSIVSEDKLRAIEAANYVCWKLGIEGEQQHKIWTHLGLILLSDVEQHLHRLLPQQTRMLSADIIKKCAIDCFWQASMRDILTVFDWNTSGNFNAQIDLVTIDEIEIRKKERKKNNLPLSSIRKHEFETFIPSTYNEAFFKIVFSLKKPQTNLL